MRQSSFVHPAPLCVALLFLSGTSCKPRNFNEGSSTTQDAWNQANNPDWFTTAGIRMNYRFDIRKTSGKLAHEPWSETYWPDFVGGVAMRWQDTRTQVGFSRDANGVIVPPPPLPGIDAWSYEPLAKDKARRASKTEIARLSPAEKYDLLMGRYAGSYSVPRRALPGTLLNLERARTDHYNPITKAYEVQPWWGLCHAWAPASLLYAEPEPVELRNPDGILIPFSSSDVKALLIAFFHYTNSTSQHIYVGKRCDPKSSGAASPGSRPRPDLGPPSTTEPRTGSQSECKDVNAGAWHVLVTNLVREDSPTNGFVFDMDDTPEVWNQPIYSYSNRYVDNGKTHPGADPRTKRSVRVYSQIRYGKEVAPNLVPNTRSGRNQLETMNLEYLLELDANDSIIGGEWVSTKFPDFVWYRYKPTSFAVTARHFEMNPYGQVVATHTADLSGIERIVSASVPSRGNMGSTSTNRPARSPSTPELPTIGTAPVTSPASGSYVPVTTVFTDPFGTLAVQPTSTGTSGTTTPPATFGPTVTPAAPEGSRSSSPAGSCETLSRWRCGRTTSRGDSNRCVWNSVTNTCFQRSL